MTTTMTALCAALLGGLIVGAPAHADADSYIGALDVIGVPYRNRAAAIQFGEVICRALDSTCQAKALIGAAVGGLCPQEQASIPSE
jgi:hypothetical protein